MRNNWGNDVYVYYLNSGDGFICIYSPKYAEV